MKKIILYIAISTILFSSMEVALKTVVSGLDAFQITFLRFLIGGLFLLPFAIRQIKKRATVIKRNDYLYMLLLGVVCIPISMVFFQLGVENSNASTAAVIFSINPMFTMMFAHFITEEKMNKNKSLALVIGICGIFFMIAPWNMAIGDSLAGAGFSTVAAITFGLYSALGRRSIRRLGGMPQTSISFILGSFVLLPILWIADKPVISGVSADNILLVIYVSFMVTGLGYLFYFLTMQHSDAATASIVFFIKPALAPVFAIITLGEVIKINGVIGIVLVFLSSYINLKEQRNKIATTVLDK